MTDDPMFAPLPALERQAKPSTAEDQWRSILPVPGDAPPAPLRHPRHGEPSGSWTYRGTAGELLGYVRRFDVPNRGKEFAPLTFCENSTTGARAWRFKSWSAPRPLYGLDRLAKRPAAPVVICEGEKSADAAAELLPNHVALTSPNGAQSAGKADWRALESRELVLWPDHDEPGRRYAHDVAALATAAGAASIAIVAVPAEWPEGWDIADALPEGATPEALAKLLQSAVPWTPTAPNEPGSETDASAEIARLAGLPPLQYDREREAAAKRLGCRTSTLDHLVATHRGEPAGASGQGRPLDLSEPEPWPQPVDEAALITDLAAAIRRHVVLGAAEADAAALWAVAVHAFDAWFVFPRLFVNSPERGCGKSTLLDVLSRLVPKPLGASNITPAALFRVIEAARPTLLLDEADTYARDNEDLRGVLDAGHRRDGAVVRTVGDDHEPHQFSAWAPVALAAIGHLPGTIEDRSIRIGLRRRRPDEVVEPLRLDRAGRLEELARKAARVAADHVAELAAADPVMPEGIVNRAADNWRPLLSVADLAGDAWPGRARRAAEQLSSEGDDQISIRVALLADIRASFKAKGVDRLSSDELAVDLAGLDDRPWPEYRAGKPISKTQIARLLKPLGISSGTIRLPDGSTPKGYYLKAFRDAFARYLPAENATTPQGQDFRDSAPGLKTPRGSGCGVLVSPGMASGSADCGVVADWVAPPEDDDEFEERAAVLEYGGGYSRTEAEGRARAELSGRRDKGWLQ